MAGDLRGIVTAIRMIGEIERSGDLVVNIAKGARRIYGAELDGTAARPHRARWARRRPGSSVLAIDAYVDGDAGVAAALDDIDDRLDDLHHDYIEEIFEAHAEVRPRRCSRRCSSR